MGSSGGSSAIFSGTSRYSADFQSIIQRTVAIASLPLQQLSNTKNTLSSQSDALSGLDNQFAGLQIAIQTLADNAGTGSFGATVSDQDIVSATTGSGAIAGNYSIEVTDLGSSTVTMSAAGLPTVSDPSAQSISAATSFTLTVNGQAFTVTPEDGTLAGLAKAINTAGANVQASIVNVGPSSAPDYRLTVQGTQMNADTIQLTDDGVDNLIDTLSTGTQATYKVNGLATEVSSTSRSITLAPGLTVQLLAQSEPGHATTITVAQNTGGIKNALVSFTNAYNSALDQLNRQRGEHPGPLAGQSIIGSLTGVLHQLGSYAGGSGEMSSMTDLGLTYDQSGHLSLDTTVFDNAIANGLTAVTDFLGSTTTGGFAQAATDILNGVEDTDSGILKNAISTTQSQISHQSDLIDKQQDRIDQLQTSLQSQMAKADALIASLEQKVTYMTNLFQSMMDANRNNNR